MAFDIRTIRQDETVDAVRAAAEPAEVDPALHGSRAWGALEGDKR